MTAILTCLPLIIDTKPKTSLIFYEFRVSKSLIEYHSIHFSFFFLVGIDFKNITSSILILLSLSVYLVCIIIGSIS